MKIQAIFDVRNLATIVTGGANGIGFAYAEAMIDNGARVTILDINAPRLKAVVETLRKRYPDGTIHGDVLDVTDKEAVHATFDAARQRYGRLDVVFANAGIHGGGAFLRADGTRDSDGAIENISDAWLKVLDTNLTSVFTTMQAAARIMKTQPEGGRIIATSSVAALGPSALVGTPYITAKTAVAGLVRQVALELAKFRIRVNAIAPGGFQTDIMEPDFAKILEQVCPTHRVGSTDEIQGLALFLASDASSYVTGTQIVIDGGLTLGMAD